MGLQITRRETMYHRKNFYETMMVHGIKCRIYSINDNHEEAYDFYNDIKEKDTAYDDYIDTYLTYDKQPTIKTLKSLGWYSDTEQDPIVAYVPVYYMDSESRYAEFKPSIDDKIQVKSNIWDETINSENSFLIKDFVSNGFPNTIYYTCKLVPVRTNKS